ncbi:hypothetical protein Q3G72_025249 [Acer saccharum]|nr:hypothetical protein Q3G72_025249 [Acer saccharum]
MNTTGRSEGINSFFDAFVTSKTNLKEFVVKYEQALKRIMGRESDEDFESEHKYRIVNDGEFLLKHAARLYTRKVFNKFKDEWNEVNRYKVEERECDDEYHTYLVKTKFGEPEEFIVKLNLQNYKRLQMKDDLCDKVHSSQSLLMDPNVSQTKEFEGTQEFNQDLESCDED